MNIEYGLIGEKLGHSYSQIIHNRLGNSDYRLLSIPKSEIHSFMKARRFRGLNVTIPYKQTVMPYCDELTDTAKTIGSVNTLLVRGDGTLLGDNTDYAGFLHLANRYGIIFQRKKVLVLGTGGTSLTATSAAKNEGASSVITVSRRGAVNYHTIYEHDDADIIINTTPAGMYPQNGERIVDLARFHKLSGVLDVIYNPLRTALLLDAGRLGIPCGGGLAMLVAQAVFAHERFFEVAPNQEKIEKTFLALCAELSNIVLVGMPGSGKTTVGKSLADCTGREFVDLDELIVAQAGKSIPDIFAEDGEGYFRELESKVILEVSRRTGLVIATGGGAVLREQNVDALRQNGVLLRIVRSINASQTEGRPLLKGRDTLRRMLLEREPVYSRCCDGVIDNNTTIEAAAKKAQEMFYEISYH